MALGATLGRLAALGSPPLNLAAGMLRAGCSWHQLGELQLDTWHRAPALPGSSLLCSIYTGDGVYSPGENAAIFLRRWLLVVSGLTGPDNEGVTGITLLQILHRLLSLIIHPLVTG